MPSPTGLRSSFAGVAHAPRSRNRIGLLLFNIAIAVAAMPACEPMLRVNGTVRDRSGHALNGVAVLLRAEGRGPHPATTDEEGAFHVSIVGAERAMLSFAKEGYLPAEVEVKGKAPPLSIVLDPTSSASRP